MKLNPGHPFIAKVQQFIVDNELIENNQGLALAVSGGIDSMVLMAVLSTMRPVGLLVAVHVNHMLRGDNSSADADFVQAQCEKLGIPAIIEKIDVAQYAQKNSISIEQAGRDLRYNILENKTLDKRFTTVALGHHADDNVETVLHRILRGTGIRGLAGIPLKRSQGRVQLIRPLLCVTRAEIEQFAHDCEIPWREDQSNSSRCYTRNKIRHDLLPLLRDMFNPQVEQALSRLALSASQTQDFLENHLDNSLSEIILGQTDDSLTLDSDALACRSTLEQAEIFRLALLELGVPLTGIGRKQIDALAQLLQEEGTVSLPGLWQAVRENNRLTIQPPENNDYLEIIEELHLTIPSRTTLSHSYLPGGEISVDKQNRDDIDFEEFLRAKDKYQEIIDADKVLGKLRLRNRRDNDRFSPLGIKGTKTLGDFFTDLKLPLNQRSRIPLLCDDRGIIWVAGLRIAHRVKVDNQTKTLLRLEIK